MLQHISNEIVQFCNFEIAAKYVGASTLDTFFHLKYTKYTIKSSKSPLHHSSIVLFNLGNQELCSDIKLWLIIHETKWKMEISPVMKTIQQVKI